MASRRISTACLASSGRNVFLAVPRCRSQFVPRLYNARQLHGTSIRFEQKANTSAKRDPAPKIVRGQSKVFKDADAAVADLKSGSIILSAGFGLCGTAGKDILSCHKRSCF